MQQPKEQYFQRRMNATTAANQYQKHGAEPCPASGSALIAKSWKNCNNVHTDKGLIMKNNLVNQDIKTDKPVPMSYEALKAERDAQQKRADALAVENAGLKKSEVPLGAIENGRAFADRLEAYPFECQGGNLNMCSDWQELRRCFEHLSEWAMHGQSETPATDAALAAIRSNGVEQFIELKLKQLASMHPDTHAFGATAMSIRAQINELQAFAIKLREAK
jgi:hypothetical protein